MVKFKLGDRVRIKAKHKKELRTRYKEGVGTVVICQQTKTRQWCRVQYSESMFDYEDIGSWRLEHA